VVVDHFLSELLHLFVLRFLKRELR
jgi:hypothetical protein